MGFYRIIFVVTTTYLALAIVVLLYIKWQLVRQRSRHVDRKAEIMSGERFARLSVDLQSVLLQYVVGKMNLSDRRRVMFDAARNSLLLLGGVMPIFSILVDNSDAQKVMNAIASLSVLLLGVLAVEEHATASRRSGYLIESLLNEWRSGSGQFRGLDDVTALQELFAQVKTVLDTNETSFVGTGVNKGQEEIPEELLVESVAEGDFIPVDVVAPPAAIAPPEVRLEGGLVGAVVDDSVLDITQDVETGKPMGLGEWAAWSHPTSETADLEITQG